MCDGELSRIRTCFTYFTVKGLPRSGGEKNYLEFIYRRPKFLITCSYTVYAVFIVSLVCIDCKACFLTCSKGWLAAPAVGFGECTPSLMRSETFAMALTIFYFSSRCYSRDRTSSVSCQHPLSCFYRPYLRIPPPRYTA